MYSVCLFLCRKCSQTLDEHLAAVAPGRDAQGPHTRTDVAELRRGMFGPLPTNQAHQPTNLTLELSLAWMPPGVAPAARHRSLGPLAVAEPPVQHPEHHGGACVCQATQRISQPTQCFMCQCRGRHQGRRRGGALFATDSN